MVRRVICGVVLSIALPAGLVLAGELLRVLTGVVLNLVDGDTIGGRLDGRPVRVR